MPIYEYRCEHCGDFEEMQRITDPPLSRCPRCKRKVRRLISSTSFQLKGSGWYVTDYPRGGRGNGAKKGESKEAAGSESKPEGKSETKSDSKPEGASGTKAEASPGGTSEKPTS
jgi:putative FmdB family regulatory protein